MVELAHFASSPFDDDIAQSDLAISADGDAGIGARAAAYANDGGSVKLFHKFKWGELIQWGRRSTPAA
jgi:hypothetical protein